MKRAIFVMILGVIAVFIKATINVYQMVQKGNYSDAFVTYSLSMLGGTIALMFLFSVIQDNDDHNSDDHSK